MRSTRRLNLSFAPPDYDFDDDGPSTPPSGHRLGTTSDDYSGSIPESPAAARAERSAAVRLSRNTETALTLRSRKLKRFTWHSIHRQALHLLQERFRCDWPDTVSIFNELFKDDITASGPERGLERDAIAAQYRERKKETSRAWQEALKTKLTRSERIALEKNERAIERALRKKDLIINGRGEANRGMNSRGENGSNTFAGAASSSSSAQLRNYPRQPAYASSSRTSILIQPTTPTRRGNSFAQYEPLTPQMQDVSIYPTPPSSRRPISEHVVQDYNYVPVHQQEAHPELPSLFYRFYDENSFGVNDSEGFIASQMTYINGGFPPAPHASDPLLFMFLENHVNRNPVSTPFISVSIGLFWVIRMALKSLSKGSKYPRIAILDANKAAGDGQENRAFVVPPYHEQLRRKKIFTNGAWHYRGLHEWVIWGHIPKEAIVHDISLQELQAHIDRLPSVARVLRFDVIGTEKRMSNINILKYLKANQGPLTSELTAGFAHLLLAFGVDYKMPVAMIAKLVSDFIQGWQIPINPDSPTRWQRHASIFAFELTDDMGFGVTEANFLDIEKAFLCGLGSGLGEFNWPRDAALTQKMIRKAGKAGLVVDDTNMVKSTKRVLVAVEIPVRSTLQSTGMLSSDGGNDDEEEEQEEGQEEKQEEEEEDEEEEEEEWFIV